MAKKKGAKAPHGRARQKFKAARTGSNGGAFARAARDDFFSEEDEDDLSNVAFRGFGGMKTRPVVPQDPNVRLRHKGIAFISAGANTPVRREEPQVDETLIAAIELNDSDEVIEAEPQNKSMVVEFDGSADMLSRSSEEKDTNVEEEEVQFIVDTVGEIDVVTSSIPVANIERLLQRTSSPTPSDSSEDVVLFQGRKKAIVIEDPIDSTTASFIKTPSHTSQSACETEPSKSTNVGFVPAPIEPFWRNGAAQNYTDFAKQQNVLLQTDATSPEAEETIEMLQAAWKQAKREKKDKKRGSGGVRRGRRGQKHSDNMLVFDGASDDEDAAYQDYLDNINAQRANSDAEVVDKVPDFVDVDMNDEQNWEDTADSELIGQDLSDVLDSDDDLNASDLESEELDIELTQAEEEILQAEEALYMRRLQGKSDEALARLWAKQIELGIEADELIIDDGDGLEDEAFGDIAAARAGFEEYTGFAGRRHVNKDSRRRARQDLAFPDASALADTIEQYGNEGFDIMDYDRPSLRQTKKARKGKMPPELEALSDDELRTTMLASWENDRDKKRLKKAEREELRAQGLLGSLAKKGKTDLSQKYQQGITIEQIYTELKLFLEDDGKTSLPFPPMHATQRKNLHEIAHALKLKSKSVGAGNTRRPVLYKTQNTVRHTEVSFNRVRNAGRGGFLSNSSTRATTSKTFKRSGGTAAAELRHGEVVGAGAKEIGKENFGHKLMEKMGWSKGMALGRDGEGVLEPVEQKMRVGRAGLG